MVCKVQKALCGLKEAPRQWFDRLKETLLQLGFASRKCDTSLFVYIDKWHIIYILVYVEDIIITGTSNVITQQLTTKLHSNFSLKQLGKLDYFLGIEIKSVADGTILLTQSKYIKDFLQKNKMGESQFIFAPMTANCKLTKVGSYLFSDPSLYRSVVGAFQYTTVTRLELSYAMNKVCLFMANPMDSYWTIVKCILRYLKGSIRHGLDFKVAFSSQPFTIKALYDANWASDPDDKRSTSGVVIYFSPNLVAWWSKKQQIMVRFSTKA